ncbi:MAG TPA: two-component regulator propeller domain-containing protein, partial [Pyrinomonadaceae bacterium]|nr:two-component regulator propeller domain-containing protein [Pyrinomonadaceae bacterium]
MPASYGIPGNTQVLPIKNFTIADGLAHNNISQIMEDSKGYLWIATDEGLSRFDGYSFANYGKDDGLGNSYINDVASDRNGHIWAAIGNGGVALFLDEPNETDPRKKFASFAISEDPQSNNVNRILFDADNRMWCATEAGVYRARGPDVADGDFELVTNHPSKPYSRAGFVDREGHLWFGLFGGVARVEGSGLQRFTFDRSEDYVGGITQDQSGRIFAATQFAVYQFRRDGAIWERVSLTLDDDQVIRSVGAADDGGLWIGTNVGLIHYRDGQRTVYSTENGLASNVITVIYSDRQNSLWLGTFDGGLSNRANRAVVNFPVRRGLLTSRPMRIARDPSGGVLVQIGCTPEPTRLLKIIESEMAELPFPEIRTERCGKNYFYPSSDHRWWISSPTGLRIAERPNDPGVIVRLPNGRAVEKHVGLYEDPDGRIWLSAEDRNLYVAKDNGAGAPRFELAARDVAASMMLRDSRGTLWLANNTFLGRLRDGNLDEIKQIEGVAKIEPRELFEDSRGRLWIGTRFDGILYTDEPDAPNPSFKKLTTADGLASNTVWSIDEDNAGAIYLGTGRGLDRYEIKNQRIRHFTSAEGIPESTIISMAKDTSGRIWIASAQAVSRIDPSAFDQNKYSPAIFISRVTIEGDEVPLAETGVANLSMHDLSASQNDVSIQFVGPTPRGEQSLEYQYKLEGYDREWSQPGSQREVTLANLGPGSYRFLVKAIDQRGIESASPAVLQFQILPPFWQRWWFLALVAIAITGALYSIYRYQLSRVVELERVRTRIATDLHDDIGSNLTRIALMSEVLNQQHGANGSAAKMLPSIANIARESVASMNDIVWAISPEHDRVLDLTRRMRQHAEEVFTIRDIDVAFVSDAADSELKLPVGVRRDVLLIFKEAVNNA